MESAALDVIPHLESMPWYFSERTSDGNAYRIQILGAALPAARRRSDAACKPLTYYFVSARIARCPVMLERV
jgi:hypothetical protein